MGIKRTCKACGQEMPLTEEYFQATYQQGKKDGGFRRYCRECIRRSHRKTNPKHCPNAGKIIESYLEANPKTIRLSARELSEILGTKHSSTSHALKRVRDRHNYLPPTGHSGHRPMTDAVTNYLRLNPDEAALTIDELSEKLDVNHSLIERVLHGLYPNGKPKKHQPNSTVRVRNKQSRKYIPSRLKALRLAYQRLGLKTSNSNTHEEP